LYLPSFNSFIRAIGVPERSFVVLTVISCTYRHSITRVEPEVKKPQPRRGWIWRATGGTWGKEKTRHVVRMWTNFS